MIGSVTRLPLPTAVRSPSASARSSWASSTSRPIPSPTAAAIATPATAVDAGARAGRGRRRHHRRRRRVDAARRDVRCRPTRSCARVVPVVERAGAAAARRRSRSTPTRRTSPRAALDAGAAIVNDVSGLLYDPRARPAWSADAARGAGADAHPRALGGHVRARQLRRRRSTKSAARARRRRATRATAAGVARERIVLDPGIGFAKRAEHSLRLLARLDHPAFAALDRPLLVGPSRKSFLQAALGDASPGRARLGHGGGGHRRRPRRRAHRPRPRRRRDGPGRPRRRRDPRGAGVQAEARGSSDCRAAIRADGRP